MNRLALILLGACLSSTLVADEPVAKTGETVDPKAASEVPETSVWMKKKMEYSQAMLRGLAMSDFDEIRANAARMNMLNQVEAFVRRKNPEYRIQLQTFNRVSAEIAKQAERKNIEGATLAFNQLTVSCVQCHESLRTQPDDTESVTDSSSGN